MTAIGDSAATGAVTGAGVSQAQARPTAAEVATWRGAHLDEEAGTTAGRVEGWYEDELSGRPEWLIVRLGRFGRNVLVPAREAVGAGRRVWVPYRRETMRNAPRVGDYEALDATAEAALLAHYGLAGANAGGRAAELEARDQALDRLSIAVITARPGT